MTTADVLEFITEQRARRARATWCGSMTARRDCRPGRSRRRLSTLSGLFGYLLPGAW